jgi:hypothetical protein
MKIKKLLRSNLYALTALLFLLGIVSGNLLGGGRVSAAQITTRSLTLQSGTDPIINGGSKAGAPGVKHFFQFTLPGSAVTNVGSIKFQYCMLAAGACTTPNGLVTTSATLGAETGVTGFSMVNTSNGAPYLTRSVAPPGTNVAVSYRLDNITNPDNTNCYPAINFAKENCTFFVRISTYPTTDTSGASMDTGTVTASTAQQISLTGTMPESLVFCTGGTVSTTSTVPDCSTATSGAISFDRLFSPTDTAITTSQMAASTNAGSGYAITVNGPTLSSGSNTITGMSSATTSIHGISQFGLNLKANTIASSNPAVGIEVAPASNGTNYNGRAATGYNTVDTFKFATADAVANSNTLGTDAQIFTVSYIVNVPGSQPAGTYTSTLTYICTPTF